MQAAHEFKTDFNTALLFDMENLLGGYANRSAINELSISRIIGAVRTQGEQFGVAGIAVNRAYANWSVSQLQALRRDMVESGVEPRQIFGFNQDGTKNAADIELVIDAMELAFMRPAITTFVIVTGDGGFSALVRKLHELGRAVIVCAASRMKVSVTLRGVCDAFIAVDGTLDEDGESTSAPAREAEPAVVRLRDLVAGRQAMTVPLTEAEAVEQTRQLLLEVVLTDHAMTQSISNRGLRVDDLGAVVRQLAPGTPPGILGARGFEMVAGAAVAGTSFCLASSPHVDGPLRLALREALPRGLEPKVLESGAVAQVEEEPRKARVAAGSNGTAVRAAIMGVAERVQPLPGVPELDRAARKLTEFVHVLRDDPGAGPAMRSSGLRMQMLGEAMRVVLPDISIEQLGFPSLKLFVQFVLSDGDVCLVESTADPNDLRLAPRERPPSGFTVLPAVTAQDRESPSYYRDCARIGAPHLYLPADPGVLMAILEALVAVAPQGRLYEEVIVAVAERAEGVATREVKRFLRTLWEAGVLVGDSPGPLSEQRLALSHSHLSVGTMLSAVRDTVSGKIAQLLGVADEDTMLTIVPEPAAD